MIARDARRGGGASRPLFGAGLFGLVFLGSAALVSAQEGQAANMLTAEERAAGWQLLFDGESMAGWQVYEGGAMTGGWVAEDGMLTHHGGGRDIATTELFSDFEMTVDWMVREAGNSGILYRAAPGSARIYHSAPEMQVLDDEGHVDGRNPLTSAGANYGLHAAPRGVVNPAGEWNEARLIVSGAHVEHWLNGTKVVEYELWSSEWKALVEASKFSEWPEYGLAPRGHIGLQDHGDWVAYRNLKVRPIS